MSKVKSPAESFLRVNPATLVMNDQVRTETDEKADKELQQSIASLGVLQPILVRRVEGKYHVIAGHRRTAAAIAAGVKDVPILCTTVDPEAIPALQLVENLQRSDMTLADTAEGVWKLYEGPANGVAKVVSEMLGKTKSWVSKMLLLNAPGKAHSVAKSLMARDKLHDIEMAYLICQIEAIDKAEAEAIASNIENETRATIAAKLKAVQKASGKTGNEGEGGEGDEGGEPGDDTPPEEVGPIFTVEVLTFMQRVITEATVKAADTPAKTAALAAIREALGQAE